MQDNKLEWLVTGASSLQDLTGIEFGSTSSPGEDEDNNENLIVLQDENLLLL